MASCKFALGQTLLDLGARQRNSVRPHGAEENALERGPPLFVRRRRDSPRRGSAHVDQRAVQAAEPVPGRRDQPARGGRIGIISDDPRGRFSRGGVLRQACHGRRGRTLVRSAEHHAGPVRDECLRRSEPKTAAAAGGGVNPAVQSEIHPAILPVRGRWRPQRVQRVPSTGSSPGRPALPRSRVGAPRRWQNCGPSTARPSACPYPPCAHRSCASPPTSTPATASRITYLLAALSRACHYHPYELAPTAAELTS